MNRTAATCYVGFWTRVCAFVIDNVLYLSFVVPVRGFTYGWDGFFDPPAVKGTLDLFISYIIGPVLILLFWFWVSATPGKLVLGARIVDAATGDRPSLGQFVLRWVAYIVAILPACAGLAAVGRDERKQGWHDKIAGTAVVRGPRAGARGARKKSWT